ncbi:LOW QUALITY PROTEIN: hypothetical protein PHMEG_00018083 [Phytophthora megakarya]|uniref:Peptidase A2 domain-containing protein n=1 Tax=Phytophthora megakarya TaxID=4795 RepID=A0A225VV72_9STRA|nr:LOW QUALITY PROTEIN: hypothetical protein PHMEG_00018083 [Phytophthora megakarya]
MESKRMVVNAKPRRKQTVSSGEEPDEKPRKNRLKAAVKKTAGQEERGQETSAGRRRVSADGSKDVDVKARNDKYLQKREQTRVSEKTRCGRLNGVMSFEWRRQHHQRYSTEGKRKSSEPDRVNLVARTTETSTADGDRGEYVGAEDGLSTATTKIDGERRHVKLDSGARYTIAGTNWMSYDDKVVEKAPVDYVEGIGGFSSMLCVEIPAERCVQRSPVYQYVGCLDELLIGVEFMKERSAVMDVHSNAVRYNTMDELWSSLLEHTRDLEAGRLLLYVWHDLSGSAVTPVQVAVAAEDEERGIFVSMVQVVAGMLVTTLMEVRNGMTWVPAINSSLREVRLPSKHKLGTWIPLDKGMEVLEMSGNLRDEKLLNDLGNDNAPLDNEHKLNIGATDEGDQRLIKQLLRVYR